MEYFMCDKYGIFVRNRHFCYTGIGTKCTRAVGLNVSEITPYDIDVENSDSKINLGAYDMHMFWDGVRSESLRREKLGPLCHLRTGNNTDMILQAATDHP